MKKAVTREVHQWPEFQAFCKRLGIPTELGTRDLVIRLPLGGAVVVEHTFIGRDETGNLTEEK